MDGNRTRLGLIDSEVPYPESYHGIKLERATGIEPASFGLEGQTYSSNNPHIKLVCKYDQTCYLHFECLALMRGVVVNPYILLNLVEAQRIELL